MFLLNSSQVLKANMKIVFTIQNVSIKYSIINICMVEFMIYNTKCFY